MADFSHLEKLHFGGIERKLAAGEYVSGDELADALRDNPGQPIPEAVLDYVCLTLEGKVAKPRGRTALPEIEKRYRAMILSDHYHKCLKSLRDCEAKAGKSAKGDMTPAERAARMTAKMFLGGEESWRTVQNIVSARK